MTRYHVTYLNTGERGQVQAELPTTAFVVLAGADHGVWIARDRLARVEVCDLAADPVPYAL